MRKFLFLVGLSVILMLPAAAESSDELLFNALDVDTLYDAIPEQAEDLLDGQGQPNAGDILDGLIGVIEEGTKNSRGVLKNNLKMLARILLVLLLCQLVAATSGERGHVITEMTGTLAVAAYCTMDFDALFGLGKQTMDEIASFSALLLPVMSGVSAASGSVNLASVSYAVTVFFSNLLLHLGRNIVIPMSYAYIGLSAADAVLQQEKLKPIREKAGWLTEWCLKGLVYCFVAVLSVTGAAAGNADAAVLKAAKTTIASFVPVVGGLISGAAESLLNGASLLKQSVGTIGMLSVFAVFVSPFFEIGVSYLMMKLAAALAGVLGSRLSGLLVGIGSALGYVLALVGSSVVIILVSCCTLLKAVRG